MKDLFKGHHPWLLVLVIAVDIFSALVIRHSILSKGESEFNANVFFCLIIIGGLALYAILVEFLSGQDMPLIGEKKGKEEMVKVPVSRSITEETSVEQTTVPPEQAPVSRDDLEQIMRNVMSDLKREVALPTGATITKDEDGIVSVNINEMKNSASELVRTQEDAKYRFACEYTMKVLGSYIKQRDVPTLLFRLGLFQRASTPNWDPRSSEDIEAGVKIQRIEVSAPVEKWALLHYGWNMGRLFGKQNNFITHFLKTTFHYHLDGLSDNQLPKKLKQNPLQGVIKIEERFDKDFSVEDYSLEKDIAKQPAKAMTTPETTVTEKVETATIVETAEITPEKEIPVAPTKVSLKDMDSMVENEDYEDENPEAYNDADEYYKDDEDDEPFNEEEWEAYVNRSLERGANSRCLDQEYLAG